MSAKFGMSVNLLPYSVYKQLGLRELQPTNLTLLLADKSVKVSKGIIEDVILKIDEFYFPADFVILNTEPVTNFSNQSPVILEDYSLLPLVLSLDARMES